MLYLIKEPAFTLDDGWYWYKIGHTDNFNQRLETYLTHCPDVTVLMTKDEGNLFDEQILHKYLHHIGKDKFKFFRLEWYGYNDESYIRDIFNQDSSIIEQTVWENRDELFPENIGIDWMRELNTATKSYLEEKIISRQIEENILNETSGDHKKDKEKFLEDYSIAIIKTEEYKKSNTKIRFSDEMKPGRNDFYNSMYKKSESFETSIRLSFKRGKFYTEENILKTLEALYKDLGIVKTPTLEDLTTEYTITRVWEDKMIPGYRCKRRDFYIKLA